MARRARYRLGARYRFDTGHADDGLGITSGG